jgi:hypothetical protein
MGLFTDLRDAAETAAVLAGNYYVPGSSLVTSRLVSQGARNQLNSGVGQLAQLGSGGYGAYEGNLANWMPSNWGGSAPVSGVDFGGAGGAAGGDQYLSGVDLGGPGASPGPVGGLNNPPAPVNPDVTSKAFTDDPLAWMKAHPMKTAAYGLGAAGLLGLLSSKPNYLPAYQAPTGKQYGIGATLASNYQPTRMMAVGGITTLPVEQMSNANSVGQNTGYPQAYINQGAYATPWQTPISRNVLSGSEDVGVNPDTDQMVDNGGSTQNGGISGLMNYARGGNVTSNLGGYSDGGRMLKGPGDGMSDSIPASISGKQPARLADGEFVVPADVVSHLGNGSTDAGAKQLYAMMDNVRKARTGRKAQGKQIQAKKYLPA